MPQHATSEERPAVARTARAAEPYELELYIAGISLRSQRAIAALTELCARFLAGRSTLTVVDIYQQPELASAAGVIAAPTLIRVAPRPSVRIIGDLADLGHVLHTLDIVVELDQT